MPEDGPRRRDEDVGQPGMLMQRDEVRGDAARLQESRPGLQPEQGGVRIQRGSVQRGVIGHTLAVEGHGAALRY